VEGIASAVVDNGTTSAYAVRISSGRQCGSNGKRPRFRNGNYVSSWEKQLVLARTTLHII
jgi:hypothetical protein